MPDEVSPTGRLPHDPPLQDIPVPDEEKPTCQLTGGDGNAFAIIGAVSRALKEAGQPDKAKEFIARALRCDSYDELLGKLVFEYVEPC